MLNTPEGTVSMNSGWEQFFKENRQMRPWYRDCKGISKLSQIHLILPYKISCIIGSSEIPLLSLALIWLVIKVIGAIADSKKVRVEMIPTKTGHFQTIFSIHFELPQRIECALEVFVVI